MADVVIKVNRLSKQYRLGVIGHGALYRDLQSLWARFRGKEDPNALIMDGRRKSGEDFLALRDLSFEVREGERLGIIGRNGAGKSTLLKILSRVTGPTSGDVRIRGRVSSLLEVGTGFHPELTGRENIYLNGALLGMNRREVSKKLDEIVDFAGVEEFIDTPVKRYSSGMHVRLGFAVAAHLEPDILIVDEVLAVGDAEFQKKCVGKMEDVSNKHGRTILFVSHNMQVVSKLCTRGILLRDGLIVKNDTIESVVDDYYFAGGDDGAAALEPVLEGDKIRYSVASPVIDVHRIELQSQSGELQAVFPSEEAIVIRFHFNVRSYLKTLTPVISIKDISGGLVMTSGDTPGLRLETERTRKSADFAAGEYWSTVTVPGGILNEGLYVVDVLLNERHGRMEGSYVTDQLVFQVLQPKVVEENHGVKVGGVIFQALAWETNRASS